MNATYPVLSLAAADLLFEGLASRLGQWRLDEVMRFDGAVRTLLQEVGLALTQRVARALAEALVFEARGQGFVVQRSQDITFGTLYGEVTVPSPSMRHPDGRGDRPVNRGLSIAGRGRTLASQRALTDFGIDDSFESAAAKMKEHYGLKIGRDSLLRVVERNGAQAMHYVAARLRGATPDEERTPPEVPVEQMLVELDGSEARTGKLVPIEGSTARTPVRKLPVRTRKTEWRDVRVGLVRPLDDRDKSYVASLSSLDTTACNLRALAMLRGAHQETQFIKVIDGGPGIREALDRAMDGPVILDRPHFHQQLYETVDTMEVPTEQRTATVMQWSRTAANGQVSALIAFLSHWRPAGWTEADEAWLNEPRDTVKLPHAGLDRVRRLAAHLKRFEDAVGYDAFHAQGFPVGSGEVESAHRRADRAVAERTRRSGRCHIRRSVVERGVGRLTVSRAKL